MATERSKRPEFMAMLGLLPPYTMDDVKQAYKRKAQLFHPDHGGDSQAFQRVREAYQLAQDFLAVRSDRRSWIAGQIDNYLALQKLEDEFQALGAETTNPHTDWLERSFGDFAELTAAIESVELAPGGDGNAVIDLMLAERGLLLKLKRLVLVDCGVTIDRALQLENFQSLHYLDLRNNRLDRHVGTLVEKLPLLKELHVENASVGWWKQWTIKRQLNRRR